MWVAFFALVVSVVFFSSPALADSSGDFYHVVVDGQITITGFQGEGAVAVIPDQIEGLPVTRIASGAFLEWSGLVSVRIPASVTHISETAFGYGLWSYTSGLASLETIEVDPGNPQFASVDGVLFNKDRTKLIRYPIRKPGDTYQVPHSVTAIAESAFLNSDLLVHVLLPPSLNRIGDYAFSGCKNITRMDVPDSVVHLGQGVFKNCTNLRSLHLPNQLNRISDYLCLNCTSLMEVNIPESVAAIGAYAFSQCRSIQSVLLPDKVTMIGDFAFSHCRELKQIVIPSAVYHLGEGVFSDCQQMESITIPSSVGEIRAYAFFRCFQLKSIQLEEGIRSIGGQAFFSCTSLTDIILPDSIDSIGTQAFSYCSSLESIRLPAALIELPPGVLAHCPRLKEIEIPDSVTIIRSRAFYQAEQLKRVTIPSSVEKIEPEAFFHCEQLEYAHFWGNAPQMDNRSFKECHPSFTLYHGSGRTGFEQLGYPAKVLNTGGLSVTFRDWDGTVLHGTTVSYGQAAIAPAQPVREGYRFIGWDRSFSAVEDNMTVTALYVVLEKDEISSHVPSCLWIGASVLTVMAIFAMLHARRKRQPSHDHFPGRNDRSVDQGGPI